MARETSRARTRSHYPPLLSVNSAEYGDPPARYVDPTPLARLLVAWSEIGGNQDSADERAREATTDAHDGPIHLVRLVAALEAAARKTGGSLTHVTDTPAVTATCGGTLHHLVEVLHASGLRAATAVARGLDSHSRYLAISALRPHWGAPLSALCSPLRDAHVQARNGPWKS